MSLLEALRTCEQGPRTLDDALGATLRRLDPGTSDEVAAAAALASLAVHAGHAALDTADPALLVPGRVPWPAARDWQQALASSRWVSRPGALDEPSPEDRPLVLESRLLYLRRYREYERRLALALRRLCASGPEPVEPALDALHARLFPQGGADDAQARAARAALEQSVLLITGGPGTGKTTTLKTFVRSMVAIGNKVVLAAPTGRAAKRIMETSGLPASTIHRLLGLAIDAQE